MFFQISALFANSDNITSESDMHVFNSGETISSSKMNENFQITKLSKIELVNLITGLRDNLTQMNSQMTQMSSQMTQMNIQLNSSRQ